MYEIVQLGSIYAATHKFLLVSILSIGSIGSIILTIGSIGSIILPIGSIVVKSLMECFAWLTFQWIFLSEVITVHAEYKYL